MTTSPRVRFAPSPTGYLHVGGLRTALYNYLFARKLGGTFVLRIEDTDQKRLVEGAVESLIGAMRWAGLEFDEGPDASGDFGPYQQSERLALYAAAADKLLASGHAYRCYRTDEELTQLRDAHQKAKNPHRLNVRLDRAEASRREAAGAPSVVRLLVPDGETIAFHDLVRGQVSISSDIVDDQILLKSDGFPTYHLANVVDDHAMEISHVIRGEEWLPSMPKHLLLYRYLGYTPPEFAHLPLLLNSDRSKLSKRQGDVAVEDYRAKGYSSAALINFVAFLGWNPGDEREVFTGDQLIEAFTLERVNKSGAIFNLEKLDWFNQQHLRLRSNADILAEIRSDLDARGFEFEDGYAERAIGLMKEKLVFAHSLPEAAGWFFVDPDSYDPVTQKKRWKAQTPARLAELVPELDALSEWTHDRLELTFKSLAERHEVGAGQYIHPVRLAVSGVGMGPSLYEMLEVLGKERVLRRIARAVDAIA